MGHEDIEDIGLLMGILAHCSQNMITEISQSRTGITKDEFAAAVNLDTGRIGAIAPDCRKRKVIACKACMQELLYIFVAVKSGISCCFDDLEYLFPDCLR